MVTEEQRYGPRWLRDNEDDDDSIVTKSIFPAVLEIMVPNFIGVMTLTFLGHVTSSITVSHDYSIRHRPFPIGGRLEPSRYL